MRKLFSNPSAPTYAPAQAPNPEHFPPKTYDPSECLRRERNRRRRKLRALWEPKHELIPEGVFRRRETVNLHRIRTGGATTPRTIYNIELSALKRAEPYAVPPDPRCPRCIDPQEALGNLAPDDRPANMGQWTHPTGDSDRRTRILRSLLDYLSRGDLRV
ncbi:unnamed protein product [Ixodes hexagonus]